MYKILTLAAALFLAGCSFRPEIPEVDTKFESTYKFETSDIRDEWWKEFGDENLNALVASALEKNTDLRTAYLNLQKAAASLGIAEADLLPGLNLSGSATRSRNSAETTSHQPQTVTKNYEINLGLNYELDLWGRVRNSVAAAEASLNATKFDYQTARLSVSSSVAKGYFALVALKMREAVLKDTLKSYDETLDFRKTQFELGSIDETTYMQSKAAAQSAEVNLLEAQSSLSSALTSLAILTGKSNDEILKGIVAVKDSLPSEPTVYAGISSDVLLRRSDVARAYADLNATNALVGVTRADYFPTISLTGVLGYASEDFNRLFVNNANLWSLSGSLAQKIFDFGKTKNNVKIAKTNEQIAAVTYEATIKKALGEVRDALNSRRFAQDALKLADELLISQEKIYELSKNRFDEGYSSHLELLDAQRNLLSTKLSQINAKLNLIDSVVNIYKAFGGGFTAQK